MYKKIKIDNIGKTIFNSIFPILNGKIIKL